MKIELKNLGPIEEAKLDIKPLTIISGKNSTGKSFIAKSLYCVFNTLSKNYIVLQMQELTEKLDECVSLLFEMQENESGIIKVLFLKDYINFLNDFINEIKDSKYWYTESVLKKYEEKYLKFIDDVEDIIQRKIVLKEYSNEEKEILEEMINILSKLKKLITDIENIILNQIRKHLKISFKKNFQQRNLSSLIRSDNEKASITIEEGSIEININEKIFIKSLKEIRMKNVIFIDSPIYLNLRKGLSRIKEPMIIKNEVLKGYPLYVEELFEFMDIEVEEENRAKFLKISEYIQNLLKGKIHRNDLGDFEFVEKNGRRIPLPLLATGTSCIATIEYLIRNNIITEGSFIILDNIDSYLHPELQVELINILYEIAKAGANVLLVSHCVTSMKAVEVLTINDSENIAINKIPYSPEFDKLSIKEKAEKVLCELTSPYSELYLEGI